MIPSFPDFKKLELNDKLEIEAFTRKFPPYSDFNFSSLFCWDIKHSCEISTINGNLLISFPNYINLSKVYSFIGNKQVTDTIRTLFEVLGRRVELSLLPESNFAKDDIRYINDKFILKEDRDSFDYILSVEDYATLSPSTMQKKRNLVKKFMDTNPNHNVRILEKNLNTKKQISSLFKTWEENAKKESSDIINEFEALMRVFLYTYDDMLIVGIFDRDKLISFSINDLSWETCAVTHFEKADYNYYGVSSFMKHALAKILLRKGYTKINYEQDLGIKGLRVSKTLLKPIGFLKKYLVTSRE